VEEPRDAPLDAESAEWVHALSGDGDEREAAIKRLHDRLVAVAHHEARRRHVSPAIVGPELDDLADQAADDALLAVLAKLPTFRGESRFTTWAYRFVVLELSHKLGRHHWRHAAPADAHDWDRLPSTLGLDPVREAEASALVDAVRSVVRESLTDRQRHVFVAAVVDGTPLDALAEQLGLTRGAVYKGLYDARQALRVGLVARGYLEPARAGRVFPWTSRKGIRAQLEHFLHVDPADVGCDEALRLLHVYVDLFQADRRTAQHRYPGIVAHLAACGPCGDDFSGLLAAVSGRSPDTADGVTGRRSLRRRPRSGQ
jgi:RNA polymerase sigma-70 factor (ECF subfamily)